MNPKESLSKMDLSSQKVKPKRRNSAKDIPNEDTRTPAGQEEAPNELSLLCQEELPSSPETSPVRDTTNARAPTSTSNHNGGSTQASFATMASNIMEYSLSTELSEESSRLIFSASGLAHSGSRSLKRQKSVDAQSEKEASRPLFPEMGDSEGHFMPFNISPKFSFLRPVTPEQQGRTKKASPRAQPSKPLSMGAYRTSTVTPAELDSTEKESKKRKNRSPRKNAPPIRPEPSGVPANFEDIMESATKLLSEMRTTTSSTVASTSTAASLPSTGSSRANTAPTASVLRPPPPQPPHGQGVAIWWPSSEELTRNQSASQPPQQQQELVQSMPQQPPHLLQQPSLLPFVQNGQAVQQPSLQLNPRPQPLQQQQQALPMLQQRRSVNLPFIQNTQGEEEQPLLQLSPPQQQHEQHVQPMLQQKLPQQRPPQLPFVQDGQPKKQQKLPSLNLSRRPQHSQGFGRLFDDVFSDETDPQDEATLDLMNAKDLEPDTSVYFCSRDPNDEDIPTEISTETLRRDESRELPWFPVPPPTRELTTSQSSSALYFGERGAPRANNNNNLLQQQQQSSPRRTLDDAAAKRTRDDDDADAYEHIPKFGTRTRAPLIDDDEDSEVDQINVDLDEFFQQFSGQASNQGDAPPEPLIERDTTSLVTVPEEQQGGVRVARTESIQGDDDIGGLLSHVLLPSPTKHGAEPLQYSTSFP